MIRPASRPLDTLSLSRQLDSLALSPTAPQGPVDLPAPTPPAPEPAAMAQDQLTLSSRSSDLAEQVKMAEAITGKPVAFKTEAELKAYLRSVELAIPVSQYDRESFLATVLQVSDLRASGREDRPTLEAVKAVEGYRPSDKLWGLPILPQQFFFDVAMASPGFFMALASVANPVMEAPNKLSGNFKGEFHPVQTAVPSDVKPSERYPAAMAALQRGNRFASDFHAGLSAEDGARPYGTFAMAKSLGFSEEQAKRIAVTDNGIDENTTPYGATGPSPFASMDRHFNLNRDGEDTRLIWASRHLNAAVAYARQGSYDQAEIELGAGLHSLQDLFAHGQLSPSVHAVIGSFPDQVGLNPIAVVEATESTVAYLQAYLKAIATPAQP